MGVYHRRSRQKIPQKLNYTPKTKLAGSGNSEMFTVINTAEVTPADSYLCPPWFKFPDNLKTILDEEISFEINSNES